MLYGGVTGSLRTCHYDTLRRNYHSFLARCISWRKNNRADYPIFYLVTPMRKGSESIEAVIYRKRILFAGFVARMGDTKLKMCAMFGELVEGAGCVDGKEKEWTGVSWTTSELSVSTPTNVDGWSPGRGGMTQDGGTKVGTFHAEMDRYRKKSWLDYDIQ